MLVIPTSSLVLADNQLTGKVLYLIKTMPNYNLPHPKGLGFFQCVSLTLFKYDPAEMAYYGEKDRVDFYDSLAKDIIRGLTYRGSEEDTIDVVYQEIMKTFECIQISREEDEVIELGKEIHKIWRSILEHTFETEILPQYFSKS